MILTVAVLILYFHFSATSFDLTCKEEDLAGSKVSIACESNRVLDSLVCFVDDDPPKPCKSSECMTIIYAWKYGSIKLLLDNL